MNDATLRHTALAFLLCAVGLHAGLVSYQGVPSSSSSNAAVLPAAIDAASPLEE